MSRVVVGGSLNMDVVVESARRPHAGETLVGKSGGNRPPSGGAGGSGGGRKPRPA